MTVHTAIAEFVGAMEASGIYPDEPIVDRLGAGLIRFHCKGDGRGKRNGWARLHLDGIPAGAFGNYRLDVRHKWRSGLVEALSPAERRLRAAEMRQAIARREAETAAAQAQAADQASLLWERAKEADPSHPYLKRKRIDGEGLRQDGRALLVPMRAADGRLWSLQRIFPDGFKSFLSGGRVHGLFWLCGSPDGALCIGEGMATMAAVRRATGLAVAAAFNASNLETVARELQRLWPDVDKIICADDDRALVDHPQVKRNIGLDYANAAALAVGGRLAVPPESDSQ